MGRSACTGTLLAWLLVASSCSAAGSQQEAVPTTAAAPTTTVPATTAAPTTTLPATATAAPTTTAPAYDMGEDMADMADVDDMAEGMMEAMPEDMAEGMARMMESMPEDMGEMAESMMGGMSGEMTGMMGMMTQSASLPPCTDRPLSVLPVPRDKILGVVPLGHLKPPEHTQPTDHVYFSIPGYLEMAAPSINLYAASDGRVIRVSRTDYDQDGNTWSDWNLTISICDGRDIRYGHVSTVSTTIQQASNASRTGRCDTYGYGSNQYQYCSADVSLDIVAGELLGTIGGLDTTNTQLDMWAYDNDMAPLAFVNSAAQPSDARQAVCPLDWFTENLRQFLYGLRQEVHLGSAFPADVTVRCGKVLNDVPGTAKGLWYSATEVSGTWQDQLALVDDNTRSARQAISVASTVADPGYWIFSKQSAGSVNRDFAQVQTGSGIHCYGSVALESTGLQASSDRFLIEVVSDNSLRIERQTSNCSGSPAFSSPFEYRRS